MQASWLRSCVLSLMLNLISYPQSHHTVSQELKVLWSYSSLFLKLYMYDDDLCLCARKSVNVVLKIV